MKWRERFNPCFICKAEHIKAHVKAPLYELCNGTIWQGGLSVQPALGKVANKPPVAYEAPPVLVPSCVNTWMSNLVSTGIAKRILGTGHTLPLRRQRRGRYPGVMVGERLVILQGPDQSQAVEGG